jgi:hypothetical protein
MYIAKVKLRRYRYHLSLASQTVLGDNQAVPDFYARPYNSPRLGIEEGEARIECPPGTVKSYLPEWPWSECIPESEAMEPGPVEEAPAVEAPPPQALPPPQVYAPPGKARFLKVDPTSGDFLDPDTGAIIESSSAFALEPVETAAAVGAGLGVVAIILIALGVFK